MTAPDLLVMVFCRGALDGLSAVVPAGEAGYYDRRPTVAVPAESVTDLDGTFGLHPALAPLAPLWAAGQLAVVHAVAQGRRTRSHFDVQDDFELGTPGARTVRTGWLGRYLAATAGASSSHLRGVSVGPRPRILGGSRQVVSLQPGRPLAIGGWPAIVDRRRRALDVLWGRAQGGIAEAGTSALDAFAAVGSLDPRTYQAENGAVYAGTQLGGALKQVAQLHKAGAGMEVAWVERNGFDFHDRMGTSASGAQAALFSELAEALRAFGDDLGARMARVTVVVGTEFGRRVAENSSGGTDHGWGSAMLVLGGGAVQGAHGSSRSCAGARARSRDARPRGHHRRPRSARRGRRLPAAPGGPGRGVPRPHPGADRRRRLPLGGISH